MKLAIAALVVVLFARPSAVLAEGLSWLRSENRNVREGNQKLTAGDHKAALAAYDRAARELPSEGGVHLDRGLALLRAGDNAKAREALRLATQPPASNAVRADAYYDLGTAFYKDADALAGEKKHDEAQKLFREASDAFKQSLRLRPGDRSTAWNHELATRRIREQEEKQKQKDQENKDQKKDGQPDKDKPQDQKPGQDQDQKQDQKQDDKKQGDKKQDQTQQDQKKDQQQQPQKQQQDQKKDEQQQAPAVRPEVDRALDALQDSEQNLERMRAINRAARERRQPEKDW